MFLVGVALKRGLKIWLTVGLRTAVIALIDEAAVTIHNNDFATFHRITQLKVAMYSSRTRPLSLLVSLRSCSLQRSRSPQSCYFPSLVSQGHPRPSRMSERVVFVKMPKRSSCLRVTIARVLVCSLLSQKYWLQLSWKASSAESRLVSALRPPALTRSKFLG